MSRASESVPGIETFVTCGARSACEPWITASGTTSSSRRSRSSRKARTLRASSACSCAASSIALPRAMMPGTFSVPGLSPNCWPPPWIIASTA